MPGPISEVRLEQGQPLSAAELAAMPVFEGITEQTLAKYPGAVVLRKFKKGEIVCREGEYGSTAFYLLSGKVDVTLQAPLAHLKTSKDQKHFASRWFRRFTSRLAGRAEAPPEEGRAIAFIPFDGPVDLRLDNPIASLGAGDLFGEMTCLNFYPRSATVRATGDCEMLEILRNILILLQKRSKTLKQKMDSAYRERALKSHLRALPMFKTVTDEALFELADRVELVAVDAGDVVVRQGDPADAMYLIRLGFVKVTQAYPGGQMVLCYLHRGDYFGAAGILGTGTRAATCTALGAAELVKISGADVTALIDRFPQVRTELDADVRRTATAAHERRAASASLPMDEYLEQGLMQAKNLLLIDLERCTRCDDCVRACADSHDGVTRLLRDGLRYDKYLVATSCRSCADPLCMVGCPVGSIRRRETLEIVIEDWCIGCGLCAKQCPYGNINMHPVQVQKVDPAAPGRTVAVMETKAVTCDLCLGLDEPSCVYACPHDAAMRVDPQKHFATPGPAATS